MRNGPIHVARKPIGVRVGHNAIYQNRSRRSRDMEFLQTYIKTKEGTDALRSAVAANEAYFSLEEQFIRLAQDGKRQDARTKLLTRMHVQACVMSLP